MESNQDFKGYEDMDVLTYLVGFEAGLPGGFSVAGAFKQADSSNSFVNANWKEQAGDASQGSYSLIAQYWNGPLGLKAGYAATLDSELNGQTQNDADTVVSFQVMGAVNGFVPYVRVAGRTLESVYVDADTDIVVRVGLEYGF